MLGAADNELLTRTGPGTPMGDYFRRFWLPVLLAQEVAEPDGPPVRVKVMGEDLVAFRDTEGRVGLLDPAGPHRGANLFLARRSGMRLKGSGRRALMEHQFPPGDGALPDRGTQRVPLELAVCHGMGRLVREQRHPVPQQANLEVLRVHRRPGRRTRLEVLDHLRNV
jgi:Rieske 2Fe-2S protein